MATTDDQLVTARGLAQSLSGAVGSVVLYDDRSGASRVSLQQTVMAFSAIDVTVGFIYKVGSSGYNPHVSTFTMTRPQAYDVYTTSVAVATSSTAMTHAAIEISGSGKIISSTESFIKIFRVVGHR